MHYHGNIVRRLFLLGAVIMLVTLPFLNLSLPFPLHVSLFAILALSMVAGLTNPLKKWAVVLDQITAIIAVMLFEYYAATYYVRYSATSWEFIVNQVLAFNFLFALYYSTKTLRGKLLSRKENE